MAVSSVRTNPWREALDQALGELNQAEHAFEWADPDYCDYYIFRIQAAQEKVALILRQARVAYGVASNRLPASREAPHAITAPPANEHESPAPPA